ncbi:hypothetical protein BQ8794_140182 [Mesorhizobium prunaredense]|uniref:Uncharacterized protein n=1 Tax=Mesorhizobium prunaredense TaxID=1631249 RepID=A0A1R3V2C8_9HYPH|nr:hypothetical protein BQ8794_140182 [Mesorhizobium prunaredense]
MISKAGIPLGELLKTLIKWLWASVPVNAGYLLWVRADVARHDFGMCIPIGAPERMKLGTAMSL